MNFLNINLTFNETNASSSHSLFNHHLELSIENLFLALFLITLNVLIIFGNIFVILAICIDYHLRSPTHHLLGSLAVADLLLGTTVLPFSSFQLFFDWWPFGTFFCDFYLATDVLCCTASIYLVLVVSIDRLIGVTKPLRYHMIVTKKKMYLTIITAWILSLLVSLLGTLWKDSVELEYENKNQICEVNQNKIFALLSASLSFYIPMTIIIIIYYRIYKEARAQMKFLATGTKKTKDIKDSNGNGITLRVHIGPTTNNTNKPKHCTCHLYNNNHDITKLTNTNDVNLIVSKSYDESLNLKAKQLVPLIKVNGKCPACSEGSCLSIPSKSISTSNLNLNITNKLIKFKREKKAAKTLAIVVGCLLLCWAPFFIILPIDSLCKSCQIPKHYLTIFFWLGYCNSAMNPLIYAFSSKEFRRAYKGILQCDLHYSNRKDIEKYTAQKFKLRNHILLNNINSNHLKSTYNGNTIPQFKYTFYDDTVIRKNSYVDQN